MQFQDKTALIQLLLEAHSNKSNTFTKKKQLNSLLQSSIRPLLNSSPGYLKGMLKDKSRNSFYESIIKNNVRDKKILEIGAGAGLLALFCEKYGAKEVTALEANKEVYEVAKKTLKKNNCAKARLKNMLSFELGPEEEGKYDLIVHEIFSNNAIGEHCLPVILDAKRFLAPEGRIIPGRLICYGAPVKAHGAREKLFIANEAGFDFSAVNNLSRNRFHPMNKNAQALLEGAGRPFELFSFDFNQDFSLSGSRRITRHELGDADAFLFYFVIEEEREKLASFSHADARVASHWSPLLWPIEAPGKLKALTISHNYFQIKVDEEYE